MLMKMLRLKETLTNTNEKQYKNENTQRYFAYGFCVSSESEMAPDLALGIT